MRVNNKQRNTNTDLWKVCEMMSLCHHFHTEVGTVVRAQCIAEHLEGTRIEELFWRNKIVKSTFFFF